MHAEPQNDEIVMTLVDQALAQPADQREAYVRSACSEDPRLFEQVWEYVRWEERMKGFLLDPLDGRPPDEHPFEPGQLLDNRFRIVREVAQGGMGIVYEALDEKLNRPIAIKCAKSGFHRRLPPEVRNATEIAHPNVCKTYEIHTTSTEEGNVDFLTMEFLEGQTLAERVRAGRLTHEEASRIAQQLCLGLAEAHRNSVIHGDLKSNNVILTRTQEGVRAVITDFGLARQPASPQAAAQSGDLGGAPDYMAPELLRGERPSVASDIYALGVILHEIASGRRPFNWDAPWEDRLNARPAALKHRWRAVVRKCLEPEPASRWRSVTDIAGALAPSSARRWWGIAAAAAVVATILATAEYRRLTTPQQAFRLAMLPFEGDRDLKALGDGLLLDTGDRLSHVKPGRARLTVIPLSDALQNKVDTVSKARTVLSATHAISGKWQQQNGQLVVRAYLIDTRTQVRLA